MTDSAQTPPVLDDLLAHAGWLRRLATGLVHDSGQAEDLAQEVFLVALRERPTGIQRPRAWLAAVARKLAFTQARSSARRSDREHARPTPPPGQATDELVAEAELGRAVARLVLDLHEPYRTVLLMHYWRDLPPRGIAAELERPVETVKVQLRRGLEHLRARLDAQHGGRKSWALLLVPLASPRSAAVLPTGVVALLATGAVVGIAWIGGNWKAGEAAVIEAAAAPTESRPERRPRQLVTPPAAIETVVDVPELPRERAAEPEPAPLVVKSPIQPPDPAPVEPDWPLQRGCLRDLEGVPLAGVRLVVPMRYRPQWAQPRERERTRKSASPDPESPAARRPQSAQSAPKWKFEARSDGFGLYELHAPGPGAIVCGGTEFQVFGWARTENPDWGQTHDLFATEAVELCGSVVDGEQHPRARMEVEFLGTCPPELLDYLPEGIGIQPTPHSVTTDERGEFCLSVPAVLVAPRSPDRPRQLFLIEDSSVPVKQAPRFGVSEEMLILRNMGYVEHAGAAFIDHQLDLSGGMPEARVELVFFHELVRSTWRIWGRVRRPNKSSLGKLQVVFAGFMTETDEQGDFELEVGDVYVSDVLAVFEVGQPPLLEEHVGALVLNSHGRQQLRHLTMPRKELTLTGTLLDGSGTPIAGRRFWLADPTYLQPLSGSLEANAAGSANSRTVSDAEGRFSLAGLLRRRYRIEVQTRGGGTKTFGPFSAGKRNLRLVLEE